ncbi:hypothetical protein [Occultella gossypii]|uniref:Uncharacterized protein n=1 Tax=Occultella gossypii TaxID=2800820 RepID=A0ABS7SFE3_9MICO|nr:hypothetical protein [Occultella gossypii]MBZ2198445.1 hypothetical protein [Occultella gossypii]
MVASLQVILVVRRYRVIFRFSRRSDIRPFQNFFKRREVLDKLRSTSLLLVTAVDAPSLGGVADAGPPTSRAPNASRWRTRQSASASDCRMPAVPPKTRSSRVRATTDDGPHAAAGLADEVSHGPVELDLAPAVRPLPELVLESGHVGAAPEVRATTRNASDIGAEQNRVDLWRRSE